MWDWTRQDKSLLQILIVLRDAARALHHVHENGLVHGRLKPENLLIDENNQPRLTDAGLGRAVRHDRGRWSRHPCCRWKWRAT